MKLNFGYTLPTAIRYYYFRWARNWQPDVNLANLHKFRDPKTINQNFVMSLF